MSDTITLQVNNEPLSCQSGTLWQDVARAYDDREDEPIALVRVNGRLRELCKKALDGDCARFVTVREPAGYATYMRSVLMLMLKVMYEETGVDKVIVHFLMDHEYYCTLRGSRKVTQEWLEQVRSQMLDIAHRNLPIDKHFEDTMDVLNKFGAQGKKDKEMLFRFRRASKVNLYNLDGYEDYYYGYMMPDTSSLTTFDLNAYEDGFLLRFPPRGHFGELPSYEPEQMNFSTLWESEEWGMMLGLPSVGALNNYIVSKDVRSLILTQEAYHEKKIAEIAQQIASDPRRRIILIAGPSSSGKTTFSHRLSTQLAVHGLQPHPIPVDDYFVEREFTPRDEFGNYDFECLEAIDTELFNRDMLALLNGEEVELPTFNFQTGSREYKGKKKKLGKNDILVIEGIHGLNDKLTEALPAESKFRIYISALTQLNIDRHNPIAASDGRLIRRIVRDARTRGYDAAHTISMWSSVQRGEERYIYPFRDKADVMFNSALIYELGVLKIYAEPLLFSITPDMAEYEEAKRLLKFLEYFLPLPSEGIPNNSLIREFIGGGCFDV